MRFCVFAWLGCVLVDCVECVQGGVYASVCWAK